MQLRSLDAAEWMGLAARFEDLTFEQTAEYAIPAAARIGGQARFVAIEEGGQPVAAAALRVRSLPGLERGITWCPSGPLLVVRGAAAPGEDRLATILATLKKGVCGSDGHVLRLRSSGLAFLSPAVLSRAAGAAGFVASTHDRPYRSLALDLSLSEEELKRRLNGKWRTDLRFVLKSELVLEQGKSADLKARFMTLFMATQAAKGFRPDIPPEFHFALNGPGYAVEVLIASKDGRDLAGIVVGFCAASATYLFGATAPAGRPLRAGYMLQWQAQALARARGCRWYDLGGIDADENPDVTRFKARMNGAAIEAGVWQAVPRGPVAQVVLGLERLRRWLRRRG